VLEFKEIITILIPLDHKVLVLENQMIKTLVDLRKSVDGLIGIRNLDML
jgi:hypothetical protein